ncbi:MAG: CRISPR-associated endonuclease Cas2 [Desulfococcaceae bacterium]
MKRDYLLGYDIANARRLAKMGKLASGFGRRVQYSFYHCRLSERQKKQLLARAGELIKEDEDQVLLMPVTEKQLREMECLGLKLNLEAEGIFIV